MAARKHIHASGRGGVRFKRRVENKCRVERRLAEDNWFAGLYDRFQRGAAGASFAVVLVSIVGMTVNLF